MHQPRRHWKHKAHTEGSRNTRHIQCLRHEGHAEVGTQGKGGVLPALIVGRQAVHHECPAGGGRDAAEEAAPDAPALDHCVPDPREATACLRLSVRAAVQLCASATTERMHKGRWRTATCRRSCTRRRTAGTSPAQRSPSRSAGTGLHGSNTCRARVEAHSGARDSNSDLTQNRPQRPRSCNSDAVCIDPMYGDIMTKMWAPLTAEAVTPVIWPDHRHEDDVKHLRGGHRQGRCNHCSPPRRPAPYSCPCSFGGVNA